MLIPRFGILGAPLAALGSQIVSAPTFLIQTARRLEVPIVGLTKGAFLAPSLYAGNYGHGIVRYPRLHLNNSELGGCRLFGPFSLWSCCLLSPL
jgi:hypothetical protein